MLASLYPEIRLLHVALALASGAFFALRGLARQFGARWPLARSVRYASYLIDTLLLLAGIALVLILGIDPLATPWLLVKLLLLVLYIVLGSLAIKRARGRGTRLLCYLGALAVFAAMYSVARAHHPLGALAGWLR